jgi:hypothetical protein
VKNDLGRGGKEREILQGDGRRGGLVRASDVVAVVGEPPGREVRRFLRPADDERLLRRIVNGFVDGERVVQSKLRELVLPQLDRGRWREHQVGNDVSLVRSRPEQERTTRHIRGSEQNERPSGIAASKAD